MKSEKVWLMLVLAMFAGFVLPVVADEAPAVEGFTLVQGNALSIEPGKSPAEDESVATLSEVVHLLDRLWEAGKGEDQPLCVREGFFRKTDGGGWKFTPAIRARQGAINVVSIPSGNELMYWVVKRPSK